MFISKHKRKRVCNYYNLCVFLVGIEVPTRMMFKLQGSGDSCPIWKPVRVLHVAGDFRTHVAAKTGEFLSHLHWIAKIFVFILLLIILTVAISFLFWCLDMHWNALKLRWLVPLSKIRVCVFVHYNIKLKPLVLLVLLFIIRESHINIDFSDNSNQSLTYMYVGTFNIYVPIYILV